MVISPVTGVLNSQTQSNISNADNRLRNAIASIVSGRQTEDVANVSIASQLQSVTSGLRQVSSNLALGTSLTQVADGNVQQIQEALGQLQNIAQQAASPTVNDTTRQQLNQQFSEIAQSITQIAQGTQFNGKNLLDGSLSGDNALSLDSLLNSESDLGTSLNIASLNSNSLLGDINVLSAEGAGQAITAIAEALNQVTSTRTSIGAFQQAVNFAAANIESAIANQEAAQATLSDADIAAESTNSAQAEVQRNASIALAAQGNRLSPQLLQLVG